MKRFIFAVLFIALCAAIFACAPSDDADYGSPELAEGQYYFIGVVREISGNILLVECVECPDNVMNAGTSVHINPQNVQQSGSLTEFHLGQHICVIYDGCVMETYPLQLGAVYGIYQADETVNCN